jgi:phytanoyl-CoA hydroxylase
MMNSLVAVQKINAPELRLFVDTAVAAVTHPRLFTTIEHLFGTPPKLGEVFFFEGSGGTPPHQDVYYAQAYPNMISAWVALEDIQPGAGRLFVYPKSHALHIAFPSSVNAYADGVRSAVRDAGLTCHAPALAKGDAIIWTARTVHGSLKVTQPQYSRTAISAHYAPA